jgi:hypothetical protein
MSTSIPNSNSTIANPTTVVDITSTSSSYVPTYTPSIPKVYDPYIIYSKDRNGTVFIAVGTIIIAIFVIVFFARFWYWLKNRKAAKDATRFDDYFGNGGTYNDSNQSSFTFLQYDSSYFDEKKSNYGIDSSPNSSNRSNFSHSSLSSTSSSTISNQNNANTMYSNMISKPGHNLRNALTQTYVPSRNRNSFISPIDQLINDSKYKTNNDEKGENEEFNKRLSYSKLLDSPMNRTDAEFSNTIPSQEKRKRKTQSISILFNGSDLNDFENSMNQHVQQQQKPHFRSTSVDFNQLEKMVNQSLVDVNKSSGNSTPVVTSDLSKAGGKKKNRPPSAILDSLVQY